jgi:16S rRNA (uracil1498-N3)-methyltransferase
VAIEAAMQSRRTWLPTVEEVASFDDLVGRPAGIALADLAGEAPSLDRPFLLVGPEGGWTPHELAGAPKVRLGPAVYRAETAALAAGIILAALREGLVKPADIDA